MGDRDLWSCTQVAPNGALVQQGVGMLDQQVTGPERNVVTLNAVPSLAAGTCNVGLCGITGQAGSWNSNGNGYTTAIVATSL